jgi:hypothetical protein
MDYQHIIDYPHCHIIPPFLANANLLGCTECLRCTEYLFVIAKKGIQKIGTVAFNFLNSIDSINTLHSTNNYYDIEREEMGMYVNNNARSTINGMDYVDYKQHIPPNPSNPYNPPYQHAPYKSSNVYHTIGTGMSCSQITLKNPATLKMDKNSDIEYQNQYSENSFYDSEHTNSVFSDELSDNELSNIENFNNTNVLKKRSYPNIGKIIKDRLKNTRKVGTLEIVDDYLD